MTRTSSMQIQGRSWIRRLTESSAGGSRTLTHVVTVFLGAHSIHRRTQTTTTSTYNVLLRKVRWYMRHGSGYGDKMLTATTSSNQPTSKQYCKATLKDILN